MPRHHERTRNRTSIMLEDELYRKIYNISYAQKNAHGIKSASMSSIVNKAIEEYIENHKEELNALFDVYREKGAKIEL